MVSNSGFGERTVLIEIDLSGRRLRFGVTVFSKYDFQGFNCGRMHRFWLVRFSGQDLGCDIAWLFVKKADKSESGKSEGQNDQA